MIEIIIAIKWRKIKAFLNLSNSKQHADNTSQYVLF